jgi:hypothetical protein
MNVDDLYNAVLNNPDLKKISPLFNVFMVTYESFIASVNNQELEALENIFNKITSTYSEKITEIISFKSAEKNSVDLGNWVKEKHDLLNAAAKKHSNDANEVISPPPLKEQAVNFISSMKDFAASGFKTVTTEQYEERKKICLDCKFFDPNGFAGLGRCRKCGCSSYKLNVAASYCPIGLWGSIE